MIAEGSVYLLQGSESKPHYHIVVFTDQIGQDKRCIICYLSSSTTLQDLTTTFEAGEDFFIDRPCWVRFRNAKIMVEMDIENLTSIGVVSNESLEKIKDGFKKSLRKIPREVKTLWESWEQDQLFSS